MAKITIESVALIPSTASAAEVAQLLYTMKKTQESGVSDPIEVINTSILALLETNGEIKFEVVYGLTAIALRTYRLLKKARSFSATLNRLNDEGILEVISNNHRWFEVPQPEKERGSYETVVDNPLKSMRTVDPVYRLLRKAYTGVTKTRISNEPPYHIQLADGLLSRLNSAQKTSAHRKANETQSMFDAFILNMTVRFNLSAVSWHAKDERSVTNRIRFEGVLRNVLDQIKEEGGDNWEAHLFKALQRNVTGSDPEDLRALVVRIQNKTGPIYNSLPDGPSYIQQHQIGVDFGQYRPIPKLTEGLDSNNGSMYLQTGKNTPIGLRSSAGDVFANANWFHTD